MNEANKEYLRQVINDCATELESYKYRRQLELLDDAVVIYKLTHPSRSVPHTETLPDINRRK